MGYYSEGYINLYKNHNPKIKVKKVDLLPENWQKEVKKVGGQYLIYVKGELKTAPKNIKLACKLCAISEKADGANDRLGDMGVYSILNRDECAKMLKEKKMNPWGMTKDEYNAFKSSYEKDPKSAIIPKFEKFKDLGEMVIKYCPSKKNGADD